MTDDNLSPAGILVAWRRQWCRLFHSRAVAARRMSCEVHSWSRRPSR